MKISFRTFNSRFARRLFGFLFLAITVPVLVLASVTLWQVSDELSAQHQAKLRQDAKHIGMNLFERLQYVTSDLQRVALHHDQRAVSADVTVLGSTYPPNGNLVSPVWLEPDEPTPEVLQESLRLLPEDEQDGVWIAVLKGANAPAVMAVRRSAGRVVVGQVRPEYLWDAELMAEDQLICVIDQGSSPLFCNQEAGYAALEVLGRQPLTDASGFVSWESSGNAMLATYREVFLQGLGMTVNWTVILSEPKRRFLAPTGHVGFSMSIVILASMLAALMLSIRHIRRILRPLDTLSRAARRVGDGHLDKPVEVDSGDEFEGLADSFNGMMDKLAIQFHQLQTLADIDRLILSSMDPEHIVSQVAERVRQLLGSELLMVIVEQRGEQRLVVVEATASAVAPTIDAGRIGRAIEDMGQREALLLSEPPAWLACGELGLNVQSWTLVPLQADNEKGLVLVGNRQAASVAEGRLPATLQSARRISIALTRARWQSELYRQAHHDELTGLPNRTALKLRLTEALERSVHGNTQLAVMFVDLDRFKLINDALGHAAGDEYLCQIAERIRACAGTSSLVARLGGDEFTIAVTDIPGGRDVRAEVKVIIERLLAVVCQPVRVGLHELRSTMSIGVAVFPEDGRTLDDLMKQADTAMYQSKRRGGNSYHFFIKDMHVAAQQRMELESDIRHALETDGFELYYQPQMCAETGGMIGAEVLLRWQHPTRGAISPGVFIPIAEESMLIADIDRWVLNAACAQIRDWLDEGLAPVPLSINISAAHFQQPEFVERVRNCLAKYDLDAQRVELEITEGALIRDLGHALASLRALHDEGVKLAIDDFGTGYCSLGYLKDMPVDKLKIDQSFIRDITHSSRVAAIVEAILQLAHRLGLKSVAEGVETEAERLWLHENGCHAYQGYFFHRPMAIDDFRALLVRHAQQHLLVKESETP